MTRTRTLLALFAAQMLALGVAAQSRGEDAVSGAELWRGSGGLVEAIAKGPRQLSGSLSVSQSSGTLGGSGYGGTLGGTLVDDRLWFFAAASVLPSVRFSSTEIGSIEGKATAQPVDWASVSASFNQLQRPVFASIFPSSNLSLPTSFLSLRSTAILSDRATLNFSFSRSSAAHAPLLSIGD